MRKLITAAILLTSVSAFAWIKDKPAGAKFEPEQSQATRAAQQSQQRVQRETGYVPEDTETSSVERERRNPEAAAALRLAEQRKDGPDQPGPNAQPLSEAQRRLKAEPASPAKTAFWGLLIAVLGFGAVLGARTWANKNIPEMPQTRRPQW